MSVISLIMKIGSVLSSVAVASSAFLQVDSHTETELKEVFQSWMTQYNKSYTPEEYAYRFPIFVKTLRDIEASSLENPEVEFGLNDFADLTDEEAAIHMGLYENGPVLQQAEEAEPTFSATSGEPENVMEQNKGKCGYWKNDPHVIMAPYCIDWTKHRGGNCAGPVRKPQTSCPASAAFAVANAVEGVMCRSSNVFMQYSPQMIVDCSPDAKGCSDFTNAISYVMNFAVDKGVCADSEYPWAGKKQTCNRKKCSYGKLGGANSARNISMGGEESVMKALITSPVPASVSVSGFLSLWRNYKSGVLTRKACWDSRPANAAEGPKQDHFVSIVGYERDSKGGETVFKIKNNWGASWGENGFARLESVGCGIGFEMGSFAVWDSAKRLRDNYRMLDVLGKNVYNAEAEERI